MEENKLEIKSDYKGKRVHAKITFEMIEGDEKDASNLIAESLILSRTQ